MDMFLYLIDILIFKAMKIKWWRIYVQMA